MRIQVRPKGRESGRRVGSQPRPAGPRRFDPRVAVESNRLFDLAELPAEDPDRIEPREQKGSHDESQENRGTQAFGRAQQQPRRGDAHEEPVAVHVRLIGPSENDTHRHDGDREADPGQAIDRLEPACGRAQEQNGARDAEEEQEKERRHALAGENPEHVPEVPSREERVPGIAGGMAPDLRDPPRDLDERGAQKRDEGTSHREEDQKGRGSEHETREKNCGISQGNPRLGAVSPVESRETGQSGQCPDQNDEAVVETVEKLPGGKRSRQGDQAGPFA